MPEPDRILWLDADTNRVVKARASLVLSALGVYKDQRLVCPELCSGLRRSGNGSNGTSGLCDQRSWAETSHPRTQRKRSRRRVHVRECGDIEGHLASYRQRGEIQFFWYTMLALLQTFRAQTPSLLSFLASVLLFASVCLTRAARGAANASISCFRSARLAASTCVSLRRGWLD